MKKSKILLACILILSSIGASFAYKAKRSSLIYYTTNAWCDLAFSPLTHATIRSFEGVYKYYTFTAWQPACIGSYVTQNAL